MLPIFTEKIEFPISSFRASQQYTFLDAINNDFMKKFKIFIIKIEDTINFP